MGVALVLVALPIWISLDSLRFRRCVWRVAGYRQWVWSVVPVLLVAIAFLPLGVWWFRLVVLAADATCIPYLAKVRPMLRLPVATGVDDRATGEAQPSTPTVRIEARLAHRSFVSDLRSWFEPYHLVFGSDRRSPYVVAVNGRDEERVLFVKPTWQEALDARDRTHDDLVRLGLDEWRRVYGVPLDFLV